MAAQTAFFVPHAARIKKFCCPQPVSRITLKINLVKHLQKTTWNLVEDLFLFSPKFLRNTTYWKLISPDERDFTFDAAQNVRPAQAQLTNKLKKVFNADRSSKLWTT